MAQYTVGDLKKWLGAKVLGSESKIIEHISIDSRKLLTVENCMFVCIVGERHNGHHYISSMYKKGIRIFLVSDLTHDINDIPGSTLIIVKNTLSALQKIATQHRSAHKIPVVGITGSNAKTIIKEWIAYAISSEIRITRSPKSFNSQVGVPLSLWMLDEKSEFSIFEAGISKPGEMIQLQKMIKPTHGIFTNIGQAHQENFSSIEEKIEEKLALFKEVDYLFYCIDHTEIHQKILDLKLNEKCKTVCWSFENKDVFCHVESHSKKNGKSQLKLLINKKDKYSFELPFADKASLENVMHVLNFLLYENFNMEIIGKRIATLPSIAMRLEQRKGRNNCIILNDAYNFDFNSLQIAIDNLRTIKKGSHVIIISDILQSGLPSSDLYQKVADKIASSRIDELICIGPEISKNYTCFKKNKARFFNTTYQFLNAIDEFDFENKAVLIKGARNFQFERIVNSLEEKIHETVLEINLEGLISNLNYFRSLLKSKTKIMVMAKALTYGSGGKEIANILQHHQVDYLGVAFADEGAELRRDGIHLPIMVLSPTENAFRQIIENELEPEIYSLEILRSFVDAVSEMQIANYPVHLKLDTGMHRLGFMENEIDELIAELTGNLNIKVKSFFSHLAVSDNPNEDDFTKSQLELFTTMSNKIERSIGYKPFRHILNSAGIERFPDAHYDMVRLGIGLHGISSMNKKLTSVSQLRTVISQIKKIPEGETIGYNRRGKAEKNCTIAILPIGYADGLNRRFGNGVGSVVINKKEYPFMGDICMDMCMVDISGQKSIKAGDEVIIFGPERSVEILANEIGTIPYEIFTNISQRVKRVYLHE